MNVCRRPDKAKVTLDWFELFGAIKGSQLHKWCKAHGNEYCMACKLKVTPGFYAMLDTSTQKYCYLCLHTPTYCNCYHTMLVKPVKPDEYM